MLRGRLLIGVLLLTLGVIVLPWPACAEEVDSMRYGRPTAENREPCNSRGSCPSIIGMPLFLLNKDDVEILVLPMTQNLQALNTQIEYLLELQRSLTFDKDSRPSLSEQIVASSVDLIVSIEIFSKINSLGDAAEARQLKLLILKQAELADLISKIRNQRKINKVKD
jgi:hypothetical protein